MLVFDEARLTKLQLSLFEPATERARTLYHYTSLDTLKRFVEDRRMFVTDVRFMNDASELQHAASVVNWLSKKRIIPREFATELVSILTDMSVDAVCYVGCFSEKASRLSQWRAYSRLGSGVSVGFSTDSLQRVAEAQGFTLGKCVYNKHRQREVAGELLNCIRCLKEPEHCGESRFEEMSAVLQIASLLKNPAFEEEHEWRVISTDNRTFTFADVQYRSGRNMLIPHHYLSLPVGAEGSITENSLEVDEIILGPTENAKLSLYSLRRYLSKHGVWNMKGDRIARACGIPLREM